jgi:CheY-like chemotaxis protein
MKLLIADDMGTHRTILSMSLKKLGHEFVAAEDGQQAWEMFQKQFFPIVVTDWQMPRLDGIGLCRRIRQEPHEQYTYILVLTTLDGRMNYLEAIDAGADDFLVKPYEEDLLAARLLVGQRIGSLMTKVKHFEGMLPMCPTCRKIRAEDDHWMRVEQYFAKYTKANIVHGSCPECSKALQVSDRGLLKRLRAPLLAASSRP